MSGDEQEDADDGIPVTLPLMTWAEVAAALQLYVRHESTKDAPVSRRDALYALREIDRQVMGEDEQAPPDDVLGGAVGE